MQTCRCRYYSKFDPNHEFVSARRYLISNDGTEPKLINRNEIKWNETQNLLSRSYATKILHKIYLNKVHNTEPMSKRLSAKSFFLPKSSKFKKDINWDVIKFKNQCTLFHTKIRKCMSHIKFKDYQDARRVTIVNGFIIYIIRTKLILRVPPVKSRTRKTLHSYASFILIYYPQNKYWFTAHRGPVVHFADLVEHYWLREALSIIGCASRPSSASCYKTNNTTFDIIAPLQVLLCIIFHLQNEQMTSGLLFRWPI